MNVNQFPGSKESKELVFQALLTDGTLSEADREAFDDNPIHYLGGTLHLAVSKITEILSTVYKPSMKGNTMADTKEKAPKKAKAEGEVKDRAPRKDAIDEKTVFAQTGKTDNMRKGIGMAIVELFDGTATLASVIKKAEKKVAENVKSAKFTEDPKAYVMKHVRRGIEAGALKAV